MNEAQQAYVGREMGKPYLSEWITIDQPLIDKFADTTRDWMFLHVDADKAAGTAFGGTIAHGFLVLSLLAPMRGELGRPAFPGEHVGLNYGLERVRFLCPVRSGSRIRGEFTLRAIDQTKPGRFREALDVTVLTEGEDRPALVGTWLTMYLVQEAA